MGVSNIVKSLAFSSCWLQLQGWMYYTEVLMQCGPTCSCHFCKNSLHAERETCTNLLVQDLQEEPSDIKECDDDLEDWEVKKWTMMRNTESWWTLYLGLNQMKTNKTPAISLICLHSYYTLHITIPIQIMMHVLVTPWYMLVPFHFSLGPPPIASKLVM